MSAETFERNKPNLQPGPPPPNTPTGGSGCVSGGVNTEFMMTFDGGDAPEYNFLVYATPPISTGAMSVSKSKYKLLQSTNNVGLNGVLDFTDTYTKRFGNLVIGDRVAFNIKAINLNSGQVYDTFIVIVDIKDGS